MGPKGVSVDRNGHIIVVDNKACCVFIFQPNGKIVTRFGSRGNGDRQFAGTLFCLFSLYCRERSWMLFLPVEGITTTSCDDRVYMCDDKTSMRKGPFSRSKPYPIE